MIPSWEATVSVALEEPMSIRGAEEEFDDRDVGGEGDFGVGLFGFDEDDGLGDEVAGGGVVGDDEALVADGDQGAADDLKLEGLRSLDGPEEGTVEVAADDLAVLAFFDGVGDALGGDGSAVLGSGGEGFADQFGTGAGAGAVVDCNELAVSRKRLQAVPDGVLTFLSAFDELEGFVRADEVGDFAEGFFLAGPDDE